MYKKFLIVASKKDKAGSNITTQLSQFENSEKKFNFHIVEEDILHAGNLNHERINDFDFVIFASKHSSAKKEKTLSVHAPGNFRDADFGGLPGKVCPSSALFQKQIFQKLNENAKDLTDYKVTLECTHHGPLIEKPCVFIEVGGTETEWNDRRATFVVAKTISDIIDSYEENPYLEVGIGIGGPHYCPGFNKLQLESNVAISHVLPQYASPLSEEMIKEAWEKTEEEVDFAILDWKGLGTSEERKRVIEILDNLRYPWKKRSEIKR